MEANTTLLTWAVVLTGLAVLLQAGVLLGIFLALRKTAHAVNEVTKDVKTTVIPLVHDTRDLLERVSPHIQTISTGLATLIDLIQKESTDARVSVSDVVQRAHVQAKRVDGMVTVALNAIEKTAVALEHSVAAPVRQVNGVVAALKAIVGTYRSMPGVSSGFNGPGARPRPVPDPDRDIVL